MQEHAHTIECPCDKKKQFPIVVTYSEDPSEENPNTHERQVFCPFCASMLSIEVPGDPVADEYVFRNAKRIDG